MIMSIKFTDCNKRMMLFGDVDSGGDCGMCEDREYVGILCTF